MTLLLLLGLHGKEYPYKEKVMQLPKQLTRKNNWIGKSHWNKLFRAR